MILPANFSTEGKFLRCPYELRPKRALLEFLGVYDSLGEGGRSDDCRVHIDGDFIIWAVVLAMAPLAYATYTAITAGRRKRKRRREVAESPFDWARFILGKIL